MFKWVNWRDTNRGWTNTVYGRMYGYIEGLVRALITRSYIIDDGIILNTVNIG